MPRKAKKATRKTTARKSGPAKKGRAAAKKGAGRKMSEAKAAPAKRKPPKAAKKITLGTLKGAYSKSQILGYLADCTELTKKDISNLFDALSNLMAEHLKSKGGPGEFTIPGLMKCVIKRKPATKARKGTNPFTGEEMMFKAKPARNIVKIRPLKKLKEMV